MWEDVLTMGLVMAIASLGYHRYLSTGGLFEGDRSLDQAHTAGFTVLVFAQLFKCFSARSEFAQRFPEPVRQSLALGSDNAIRIAAVAVVEATPLNVAFGTKPLTLDQRIVCLAMSSTVLWVAEAREMVHAQACHRLTTPLQMSIGNLSELRKRFD